MLLFLLFFFFFLVGGGGGTWCCSGERGILACRDTDSILCSHVGGLSFARKAGRNGTVPVVMPNSLQFEAVWLVRGVYHLNETTVGGERS